MDQKPPPCSRDVRIRNFSDAPVFNLRIEDHPADHVLVWQLGTGLVKPEVVQVLRGDESTYVLTVVGNEDQTPSAELIEFTFTDARGARWRRVGSQQPVRDPGR